MILKETRGLRVAARIIYIAAVLAALIILSHGGI